MGAQDGIAVEFPGRPHGPVRNILLRLGTGVGLIPFVTVSITTTGPARSGPPAIRPGG